MNHREKRQALFVCFYVCVHIYYIIRRRYYMCVLDCVCGVRGFISVHPERSG